jgi:hypothetical protein
MPPGLDKPLPLMVPSGALHSRFLSLSMELKRLLQLPSDLAVRPSALGNSHQLMEPKPQVSGSLKLTSFPLYFHTLNGFQLLVLEQMLFCQPPTVQITILVLTILPRESS